MPELVWRAHPKQARFLRAQEYAVLYGGAAGGGKTDGLLIDLIRCCAQHPNAQTLFLMKTFKDLSEPGAALDRSHQLLNGIADWRGGDMRWFFPNGAKLQFGHLHHENDMYNYEQAQLDRLAVDSLTSLSKRVFLYLNLRVRATVPNLVPKVRAGTNPGNTGHHWVREMFIDAAPWGEPFNLVDPETHEVMGDARFIPAKLPDNPTLMERDPTYAARLNLLPDDLRRAYRDGDWDIFAGQFFTEWRRQLHVTEPFPIPAGWPRWRAVDWGYGKPYCCLWLTRGPDRRIYVYRETYASGVLDVDQARIISKLSAGEVIRTTYADPSMWNSQANGQSVAAVYARNGISVTKANNDRNAGWQRVHEVLQGEQPQLQVFSTCLNLIRTLPLLIHDSIDVEDVDTDGEDHACLVGNTSVETDKGPTPIALIDPGCRVLTRFGYCTVIAAAETSPAARVVRVHFSDGRTLTGTRDHRVRTRERGWIRLDELRYGDIMEVWEKHLTPWSLTESAIASMPAAVPTTAAVRPTSDVGITTCTSTSGSPTTVPYLRDVRFTTATTTQETIVPRIWSALLAQITLNTTPPMPPADRNGSSNTATDRRRAPSTRPLFGTDRLRAEPGIARTASRCGPIANWLSTLATSAARFIARKIGQVTDSARMRASRGHGEPPVWMTSPRYARPAGKSFGRTATEDQTLAPVFVLGLSDAGVWPVYNLTIEGQPEFYANGILSHNCDALRYGLIGGLPAVPTKTPYSLARMRPQDNRHWSERSNGVMVK